jgi:hypothetical protein
VTGGCRKLCNEEFRNLHSSPNVIRTAESRRVRWAGHVVQMGRRELRIGYWQESCKEREH